MARPILKGVDYFPLYVGFLNDLKVRKIMKTCGPKSIAILIYIFTAIYKDEGYFIEVDCDVIELISMDTMTEIEYVEQVINRACEVNLFSISIYKKHRILTSRGIQKQYLKITERRKNTNINDDINLIKCDTMYTETSVNVAETSVNVAETGVNVYKSTQRKEKKIKENKKKEKEKENATNYPADIFSIWIQNFGDVSPLVKETLEILIDEFGVEEVVNAIDITKDRGKMSIKYVEGVLKNREANRLHGTNRRESANKSAKRKAEEVDWAAESARVHGSKG